MEDYVAKQELIMVKPCPFCGGYAHLDKAYSYFRDIVIYCEECDTVFTLDDCNATAEDIVNAWNKRQKMSEWIPVTERLPEEPGFYIVYTDSSYNPIRMLRYGMAAPVAFRNENNWYDEKGQHIYSWLVKYWMPLPEPPKEE